jgi:GT2 family glycosyltransferase
MTPASIVIPTRGRPSYLEVALESIAPQAAAAGAEIVVVDDGGRSARMRDLVTGFGARYEPHEAPRGLNVARNTGVARSAGDLVVFVDDDIRAQPGWLEALLAAARANPDVDVFAGPISARLEGNPPRTCGREGPPITALDLGPRDTDAEHAWGSNMAIRRSALERVGEFDVSLAGGGDEQEWQERLRRQEPGARVLYVAAAGVEHRRVGADSTLRSLSRAAYARGRAARCFDVRRGCAPTLGQEALTLGGCLGHVLRRRCPAGLIMAAHSAGRLRESLGELTRPGSTQAQALAPTGSQTGTEDFLSGASGTVGGLDAILRSAVDGAVDARELLTGSRVRLARAARSSPPTRRVLALGVSRNQHRGLAERIRAELERSRHTVEMHTCPPDGRGKFENINRLLSAHPAEGHDWLLVIDDDVELPPGFLDRFLFLCERFSLVLAQPAHRLNSHAAWQVTRRRPGVVVHETPFVEIGPVTAFSSVTFPVLLPFPDLRMGWGLDVHWGALAREHGWRCGVLDAVAVRHRAAPAASAYPRSAAVAEAREFLSGRPYLRAAEAEATLTTHHSW